MKGQSKKQIKCLIAVILIAAMISMLGTSFAYAMWDEEKTVHIDPKEIETSTLIVGSHLIHLSALNDSIYSIATASAGESGQMNVYYKSELGEDTWFDISSATQLSDITTSGTPVTNDIIAALFMTHHTKSDGITYDLRTGEAVDPRNIRDPYDLEAMEELFSLKVQFDLLKNTQGGNDDRRAKIKRLDSFFATSVNPPDPNVDYDGELTALGAYYTVLKENGGDAKSKNAVQGVMDAVDAARRAAVFRIVEKELSTYMDEISAMENPDSNLLSAAADSLTKVKASLNKQESNMLTEGTSVTTRVRYRFARSLIDNAIANNHLSCDGDVKNIVFLDNIAGDIVEDAAKELTLLNETLIPEATNSYTALAFAGENVDYTKAVSERQATVLLRKISQSNMGEADTCRSELELFITAKTTRQSPTDGIAFIDERLALTKGWYANVPDDFFMADINQSIDAHVDFLTKLRRKLELLAGGNEMDSLALQKGDLQSQVMSMLDNNDLAGASKLKSQIDDIDNKLDGSGLLGEQISALNQDGLDALKNGDSNALKDCVDALGGLGAGLARSALVDLRNTMLYEKNLNGNNTLDEAISSTEKALTDSFGSGSGSGNGSGSGTGNGTGSGTGDGAGNGNATGDATGNGDAFSDIGTGTIRSAADLERIAIAFFKEKSVDTGLVENAVTPATTTSYNGTALTELVASDSKATNGLSTKYSYPVINMLALEMYYRQKDSKEAFGLMQSKATRERKAGNSLVFTKLKEPKGNYISLSSLCLYTGMRYVWNSDRSVGTLARGGTYYGFSLGSNAVKRSQDTEKSDIMTEALRYQDNTSFLSEVYSFEQFGVESVYLSADNISVLCDSSMLALAEELFDRFVA